MSVYDIERILCHCPEVDCDNYKVFSELSEEYFIMMETEYLSDTSVVHVFPYVRKTESGIAYIDIYFWDITLYPSIYFRMVFCEGYCLSETLERKLQKYIEDRKMKVDETMFRILYNRVGEIFPNWHYLNYSGSALPVALEHLYYASHKSGTREILYKAGLYNIAFQLECIPNCNLIGSSPSEIIWNLPMQLLRILNQEDFIEELFYEHSILQCKKVYEKYSGFIGKKLPNAAQWAYLNALCENGGLFGGHGFIRALYEKLSQALYPDLLEYYEMFLIMRDSFHGVRTLKIPEPSDIGHIVEWIQLLEKCDENTDTNNAIRKRKENDSYDYCGREYSVLMPKSAVEFFKESIVQGNCVMNYLEDHAAGKTTILFVRDNKEIDKPYVTVEVKGGAISQAYGRFNSLPPEEIFQFLLEYAKSKGLACNPLEMIIDAYAAMI